MLKMKRKDKCIDDKRYRRVRRVNRNEPTNIYFPDFERSKVPEKEDSFQKLAIDNFVFPLSPGNIGKFCGGVSPSRQNLLAARGFCSSLIFDGDCRRPCSAEPRMTRVIGGLPAFGAA